MAERPAGRGCPGSWTGGRGRVTMGRARRHVVADAREKRVEEPEPATVRTRPWPATSRRSAARCTPTRTRCGGSCAAWSVTRRWRRTLRRTRSCGSTASCRRSRSSRSSPPGCSRSRATPASTRCGRGPQHEGLVETLSRPARGTPGAGGPGARPRDRVGDRHAEHEAPGGDPADRRAGLHLPRGRRGARRPPAGTVEGQDVAARAGARLVRRRRGARPRCDGGRPMRCEDAPAPVRLVRRRAGRSGGPRARADLRRPRRSSGPCRRRAGGCGRTPARRVRGVGRCAHGDRRRGPRGGRGGPPRDPARNAHPPGTRPRLVARRGGVPAGRSARRRHAGEQPGHAAVVHGDHPRARGLGAVRPQLAHGGPLDHRARVAPAGHPRARTRARSRASPSSSRWSCTTRRRTRHPTGRRTTCASWSTTTGGGPAARGTAPAWSSRRAPQSCHGSPP